MWIHFLSQLPWLHSRFFLLTVLFSCKFSSTVGQLELHLSFKRHLKLPVSSSANHKTSNWGKPKKYFKQPSSSLYLQRCCCLLLWYLMTRRRNIENVIYFFFLFKKNNQIVLWKHRRSVPFSLIFTDVGRTVGFLAYLDIIIFLAANLVWTSLLWFWFS